MRKLFLILAIFLSTGSIFYFGYTTGSSSGKSSALATSSLSFKTDYIDPVVKVVVSGKDYDSTTHSYYRLILRNTEYNQCLTLEKITVYQETRPTILHSSNLCSIKINGKVQLLSADSVSDVEYSNIKYDKNFMFDMSLNGKPPVRCKINNTETLDVSCLDSLIN